MIIDENNDIVIPPNDTGIIFTQEAVYLDRYYAGACYNRLTFSVRGINHSSSPLKPEYAGRLSVSIRNDTDEEFKISVGRPIVVIMIDKLHRPADITLGNGRNSRFDLLTSLGIQIDEDTCIELGRCDDRRYILDSMKNSERFREYKKRNTSLWDIFFVVLLVLAFISLIMFKQTRNTIGTYSCSVVILDVATIYSACRGKMSDFWPIILTAIVTAAITL